MKDFLGNAVRSSRVSALPAILRYRLAPNLSGLTVVGMRAVLLTSLLLASVIPALAERNHRKPSDFEPLTSLPWKQPGATLEGVLESIFREPNPNIRYPILCGYLRTIPAAQLGKAFDLCIDLEDIQTPDSLVEILLPIWGERDPMACWKRTKELFQVVGVEDGWMGYDSWKKSDRITVQDTNALHASRFWLESGLTLSGFAMGVDRSSLPKAERLRLMKEFANKWINQFGSWPGYSRASASAYRDADFSLIQMLDAAVEELRSITSWTHPNSDEIELEGAFRRWLRAEPAAAPEIMKRVQAIKWPPEDGKMEPRSAGPSIELLMIWAKADLPAMIRWAESLEVGNDALALKARGFLMSRVDAETRDRWLAEAKPANDRIMSLLTDWAGWDPSAALDAAIALNDTDTIHKAVRQAAYEPWPQRPSNSYFGLDFLKGYDLSRLPEGTRAEVMENWDLIIFPLADADIGAFARYGLDFMLRYHYAPRENLIKLFSGDDEFSSDGDMIDRTFCALRVWAVFKPKEMKAWIVTQKDAEMRKALTWLLEHPWGGPKK
jgi:hypothetical protein